MSSLGSVLPGWAALAGVLVLAGCQGQTSESGVAPDSDPVEASGSSTPAEAAALESGDAVSPYSAFGVRVQENSYFDVITFKDVGLHYSDADRTWVLEAIAESLASALQTPIDGGFSAEPVYDESFADGANHQHCGLAHIYVDVWTSPEPSRWGYSLWSGCSEDDQFAWEEVPADFAVEGDALTSVHGLAEGIASKLRSADASGCFTRAC